MDVTLRLTAKIAAAYLAKNSIPWPEIGPLLATVYSSLHAVRHRNLRFGPLPRETVCNSFIICLEDGKPYRMLKRPLRRLGLTPFEYRTRWGLPDDYPMVAPDYSKRRSEVAIALGLGVKLGRRRSGR